ncbi:oligosaccharide repeat unit polymerase [Hufsiella ginkgonis]|uniref:Oligosaccharide repeat unit polymerase n=1 Tax=Hufsiella ginkgonis TaxID=2695274 RepID=A0A7K1Y0E4_9SPHI|nr:oligosaccharide repeat unit polymerase [Hufsiella ginkgonis]MXV16700.1 hypothetical protein [Hufsiella ginkgonis]
MNSFLICITLLIFALSGYIVWPSRYNVMQHLAVGGSFVSIIVPALILGIQDKYPASIVNLYTLILTVGATAYVIGLIAGFLVGRGVKTSFSFDVMDNALYEQRVIRITGRLMVAGIMGLIISYIVMGYVPMFAEDPISAKLFRGQYQAPYIRIAFLYRTSFFILAPIMPISCIIWYKYRSTFFFFAILTSLALMAASLARSGAFMGIVVAIAIVMSFKSRLHFTILMIVLVGVFVLSSFFYYLVGVRSFDGEKNIWEIITAGTPDIPDHLDFLTFFSENPVWTYGRTMYGGLVPGHYKWNPAVYTLIMVNPGKDINEIGSGGLRLPLPIWGYVSFGYPGVIAFCVLTGFLGGYFLRILKDMFARYSSILVRTVATIAFGSVVGILVNFAQLSMYALPAALVSLLYLYRFKWEHQPQSL